MFLMNRYFLLVLFQIILSVILVFVGWEVLIIFIERKGSDWMWIPEMKGFLFVLSCLIVAGSILIHRLGPNVRLIRLGFLLQVVILFIWFYSRWEIFPYRYTFLLTCGLVILGLPGILTVSEYGRRMVGVFEK